MGMKVLHVTNIAQNAYINALILNARGHDCDVLALDLYHVGSSPEWYELQDAEIDTASLGGDAFFPNFYALGRDMPRIGDWVAHGPTYMALRYLILKRRGDPRAYTALSTLSYLRFKATIQRTTNPFAAVIGDEEFTALLGQYDLHPYLRCRISAGRLSERYFEWIRGRIALQLPAQRVSALAPPLAQGMLDHYFAKDPTLEGVVRGLRARGLSEALGIEFEGPLMEYAHLQRHGFGVAEIAPYCVFGRIWRDLASHYDACIFYADSSVFALAAGIEGYHALEHGTIRSIPFEPTTHGRLVAKAFLNARRVFLTNTDYATAKPRLEFTPEQRVYSPHPFDEAPALAFRRAHIRKQDPHRVVFFCPARQDWRSGDPKMAKGNDRYFRAARSLLDEGRANFVMQCVDWGVDRDATLQLIEDLGLTDHVSWTSLMTKRKLWAAMLDSDAVIDQFMISGFGGITFEALALGCRIISRDDGVNNGVFFEEPPPILSAETAEEIASRMAAVLNDPEDLAGLGEKGTAWVRKYHSAERIHELQMAAFGGLASRGLNDTAELEIPRLPCETEAPRGGAGARQIGIDDRISSLG